eukprot:1141675-Ditylum_brightwellii.AAC.1
MSQRNVLVQQHIVAFCCINIKSKKVIIIYLPQVEVTIDNDGDMDEEWINSTTFDTADMLQPVRVLTSQIAKIKRWLDAHPDCTDPKDILSCQLFVLQQCIMMLLTNTQDALVMATSTSPDTRVVHHKFQKATFVSANDDSSNTVLSKMC